MNPFDILPDGLVIVAAVFIIVAVILVLAAGRKDDDPAGTRTQMRYVGTIGVITLFIVLFSFYGVVKALTEFIIDGHNEDSIWRTAVHQGLLMLSAGVVFVFHYRRAAILAPAKGFARGGTGAAARAALYGVCFVAALIALITAARTVYSVFVIIAPGTFGSGGPDDTARQVGIAELISLGALTAGSLLIFLRSWNWLPEHRS
jgi:hypothetical protein